VRVEVYQFMLVLLEGNIAAGKTTLGKQLAASAFFEFVPEPVDRWQSGFAANLLERFYTDTARWAFTLQICAFVTRTQALQAHAADQNAPQRVRVFERSIYCDRHVFAKNLHQHGFMDDTEWALYLQFWNHLRDSAPIPDAIFYLRTPAEECYRRLQIRARAEEKTIPLEYLQQLEARHDEWLLTPENAIYPVVVLDGSRAWTAADVQEKLSQAVPQ
jgi:deoxyadenosine/deoxycytidine kinase